MPLIVEDGTGLANADAYVSANDVLTYATLHGYAFSLSDAAAADAAIRRATQFIDSYRARFPGYRAKRRLQGLEWPRVGAFTRVPSGGRDLPFLTLSDRTDSYSEYLGVSYIATNEIPVEIVQATCEAAYRELASPGTMAPDLERGGMVKSLRAGSVEVVYQDDADPNSTTQLIDGLLSGLLIPGSGGMFGSISRG